jgi:hypothetical protein
VDTVIPMVVVKIMANVITIVANLPNGGAIVVHINVWAIVIIMVAAKGMVCVPIIVMMLNYGGVNTVISNVKVGVARLLPSCFGFGRLQHHCICVTDR